MYVLCSFAATKRATIEKNLIPLQQNLQKRQIAQELYYNTGRSPLKMEAHSSKSPIHTSVHNRLGNTSGINTNRITSNRITTNRISTNRTSNNRISTNRTSSNRLTTNRLNSNRITPSISLSNRLGTSPKISLQTKRGNFRGRGGNATRIINRSNLQTNGVLTKKAQRLNNRISAQSRLQRARQNFSSTPENLVRSQQNPGRPQQNMARNQMNRNKLNRNQLNRSQLNTNQLNTNQLNRIQLNRNQFNRNQQNSVRNQQRSSQNFINQRSSQNFMLSDREEDIESPVSNNFQRNRLPLQRERPDVELQPTNFTVKLEGINPGSSSKHNINAQLNPRLQAEIKMIQSTSSFKDTIPSIPIHPQGSGVTKTSLHQRFSQL